MTHPGSPEPLLQRVSDAVQGTNYRFTPTSRGFHVEIDVVDGSSRWVLRHVVTIRQKSGTITIKDGHFQRGWYDRDDDIDWRLLPTEGRQLITTAARSLRWGIRTPWDIRLGMVAGVFGGIGALIAIIVELLRWQG